MSNPGYAVKVYAKNSVTDPSSGDEIDGIDDTSLEEMIDLFDVTSFKSASASAWRKRLAGLNDLSFELSGSFKAADAPQALLRSSKRSGASVWITIDFNPSAGTGVYKGLKVECLCEKFTVKAPIGGRVDFTASLKGQAAPADRTG